MNPHNTCSGWRDCGQENIIESSASLSEWLFTSPNIRLNEPASDFIKILCSAEFEMSRDLIEYDYFHNFSRGISGDALIEASEDEYIDIRTTGGKIRAQTLLALLADRLKEEIYQEEDGSYMKECRYKYRSMFDYHGHGAFAGWFRIDDDTTRVLCIYRAIATIDRDIAALTPPIWHIDLFSTNHRFNQTRKLGVIRIEK